MSVAGDLNDASFALATEQLVQLCEEIARETGRKPTVADLCEVLTWGLRSCRADLFADALPSDVLELVPRVRKSRAKVKTLTPGDVVSIPIEGRPGYGCLAVYITTNRIGWALGLLKEPRPVRPLQIGAGMPLVHRFPVYVHPEAIQIGRWPVMGHDPRLLELFPADPEIFWPPLESLRKTGLDIGPHGSAAPGSSMKKMRHISAAEAAEVGLTSGRYSQAYTSNELEHSLIKDDWS